VGSLIGQVDFVESEASGAETTAKNRGHRVVGNTDQGDGRAEGDGGPELIRIRGYV